MKNIEMDLALDVAACLEHLPMSDNHTAQTHWDECWREEHYDCLQLEGARTIRKYVQLAEPRCDECAHEWRRHHEGGCVQIIHQFGGIDSCRCKNRLRR